MYLVENTMKKKLEAGGLAAALNLVHWRGVNAASLAKECGFDWLFIDLEHNSMDLDTAAQICVAALPTGITPIVRVPSHDSFHATRVLDAGAMGVVVPHVESADEARAVVRHCKYPPLGRRSLTAPLPQLSYSTPSTVAAIDLLNQNTLLIVMLETRAAIAQADEIAAVPGIDAVMIGTTDLTAEMGIPGEFTHPAVAEAYAALIAACRRHGKHAGMGGIYDHGRMAEFIHAGVRLILGGSDVSFLITAAKARTKFLREIPLPGGTSSAVNGACTAGLGTKPEPETPLSSAKVIRRS
jgi:2-keto-3-deoxy-L-rhamnonate aldolase RhmA